MEEQKEWQKTQVPQAEEETVSLSRTSRNNNNSVMMIASAATTKRRPAEEVKLAALAVRLNARLRSVDMPVTMQERALRFTCSFLAAKDTTTTRLNPGHLASALKKEFDGQYGAVWHCIVGKSYGSYVTHSSGGFLYFSFDSLSVLLFQTKVHLLNSH